MLGISMLRNLTTINLSGNNITVIQGTVRLEDSFMISQRAQWLSDTKLLLDRRIILEVMFN